MFCLSVTNLCQQDCPLLSEFLDPKKAARFNWHHVYNVGHWINTTGLLTEKNCAIKVKKMCVFHRTLGPFHFELLCTKTRKKMDEKDRVEKQKQRSSLVMGINQVTKALERGTLKLVLVSVKILLNFCWIPLCWTLRTNPETLSWTVSSRMLCRENQSSNLTFRQAVTRVYSVARQSFSLAEKNYH